MRLEAQPWALLGSRFERELPLPLRIEREERREAGVALRAWSSV